LPQVLGIFTETLISPSPSLRQRPSRYAIRAGRNFTDPTVSDGGRLSLHLAEALRSATSIALLDRQLHRLSFVVRAGVLPATHARDEPLLSDQSLRGHEDFPRDHHLAEPGRLPRYEPVLGCSSRSSGASSSYPTRNFATLGMFVTPQHFAEWLGRFGSAQLSMSPWRSDHLFTHHRVSGVWPLRILSIRASRLSRRCLPFMFIAYAMLTSSTSPDRVFRAPARHRLTASQKSP
jgi:hypothetical protein